jgi:hypothetical protein
MGREERMFPSAQPRTILIKVLASGIVILVLLSSSEILVYVAAATVLRHRLPYLFYEPLEREIIGGFERYMADRDPVLGWPSRSALGKEPFDASGSRISPSFPIPGNACVSIYGDSFAFADEVDHVHAWGNVLAERLNCRVANYGANGYGTDQAFLRFQLNREDEARIVILAIYPEDLRRNVNRYQPLLMGMSTDNMFGLKPRFVLSDTGELELIALPSPSRSEFVTLATSPQSVLTHEYFLPGTRAGPLSCQFPYTWCLLEALQQEQTQASIRSLVRRIPTWADFASPGHPSRSFEIAAAIGRAFASEARRRGKVPLVLFFPTPTAVDDFTRRHTWAYRELAQAIGRNGSMVVDAGPYLLEKLAGRSLCTVLTNPRQCGGHFNEEGNRMLAELVYESTSKQLTH